MKARQSFLFLGIVAVLLICSTIVLSFGSAVHTGDLPAGPSPEAPAPEPDSRSPAAELTAEVTVERADAPSRRPRRDASEALDYGIVDGSVRLASTVVGKFDAYYVHVAELVNDESLVNAKRTPFAKTWEFDVDHKRSPQRFELPLPFSPYGYRIAAAVRKFNGSGQTIRVTEEHWNPQVMLAITEGAVFAMRFVDQYRHSRVGARISMMPVGEPRNRGRHDGETDSFGSIVFEHVLAGQYDVIVDDIVRERVTVTAPGFSRDELNVGLQSVPPIVIPIGPTLRVEVVGNAGYGIEGTELELIATDTTENRREKVYSDRGGIAEFLHVMPGRYQLNAMTPGYGRRERRVTIVEGELPEPIRLLLTPN